MFALASLAAVLSVASAQYIDVVDFTPTASGISAAFSTAVAAARTQFGGAFSAANGGLRLVSSTNSNVTGAKAVLLDSLDNAIAVAIAQNSAPLLLVNNDANELSSKQAEPNLFRLTPDSAQEAAALVDLASSLQLKKVVVIFDQTVVGSQSLLVLKARANVTQVEIKAEVLVSSSYTEDVLRQTTLITAAAAVLQNATALPNDVGTIIYLGSDAALFQRVYSASKNLTARISVDLTAAPYVWLVGRAALANATNLAAGVITVGQNATDAQLANDAVIAAATAINAALTQVGANYSAANVTTALRSVRFAGQSGFVSFNANQDRPAQFAYFQRVASAGTTVLQRVGTFDNGTVSVAGLRFSTNETTAPVFPWRNCSTLRSCAECSAQPGRHCGWCGATSTCSNNDAAFNSRCSNTPPLAVCPPECVSSLPANGCLFSTTVPLTISIWSAQQSRCEMVNNITQRFYSNTPVTQSACDVTLHSERGCQQLLADLSCSSSCQTCSTNSTNPTNPVPVCRTTCQNLVARHCPLTRVACNGTASDPFQFVCSVAETSCTNSTYSASTLIVDPNYVPPPTTLVISTADSTTTNGTIATVTTVDTTSTTTATTTAAPVSTVPTTTAATTTTAPVGVTTSSSTTTASATTTPSGTNAPVSTAPTTGGSTGGSTQSTSTTQVLVPDGTAANPGFVYVDGTWVNVQNYTDSLSAKASELYNNENDLRLGLGIGLSAIICVLILLAVCIVASRA